MTFEELLKEKGYTCNISEDSSEYAFTYNFYNIMKDGKNYGDITVYLPHEDSEPMTANATVSNWLDRGGKSSRESGYIEVTLSDEDYVDELCNLVDKLVQLNDEMDEIKDDTLSMEEEDEIIDTLSEVNGEDADLDDIYESTNFSDIFSSILNG